MENYKIFLIWIGIVTVIENSKLVVPEVNPIIAWMGLLLIGWLVLMLKSVDENTAKIKKLVEQ